MGDRKRRWICRLLFVFCCALPTAWTLSFLINKPTTESVSSDLSNLFGLPVSISEIETPTPFKTILKKVRLHDPEQGTLLILDRIELTRSFFGGGQNSNQSSARGFTTGSLNQSVSSASSWNLDDESWDRWVIHSAQVTEQGLPFLSTKFHEALLRLRRRTGFPIDIHSLSVIQKPKVSSQWWENRVQSNFQLQGKTVLRLKDIKLDRVTTSQILLASEKSYEHSVIGTSHEKTVDDSEKLTAKNLLPWRGGWNMTAKIADPDSLNQNEKEVTFPVQMEFHRMKQTNTQVSKATDQFLTYWVAKFGNSPQPNNPSAQMVPWSWIDIDSLKKNLDLHTSGHLSGPTFYGSLSGVLSNNHWKVKLTNLNIAQMQMSDLDQLVCGSGTDRVGGTCWLSVEKAEISNGRVLRSHFGIRSPKGRVLKNLALQINTHPAVNFFIDPNSLDAIEYQDLSLVVETNQNAVHIGVWNHQKTGQQFAAKDGAGKELLRFAPYHIFALNQVIKHLDRSRQWNGNGTDGSSSNRNRIALAFLDKESSESTPVKQAGHQTESQQKTQDTSSRFIPEVSNQKTSTGTQRLHNPLRN